jgi:glycosyltransferase involved in cell wall biosynthesis
MVKISVVMATFNAESVLPSAIDAFRAQTFATKELLIADGGSHDTTPLIIKANADAITWSISERDSGIFDAWNKGVEHSTGDWLYFMGADDCFSSHTILAEAAERLITLPRDVLVAYGSVNLIDSCGQVAETIGGPWSPERFRTCGMTIPHQGCFTRRSYFDDYGLFDIKQKTTATYELYLRHLCKHDAVFLADMIVGNMGIGGVSTRPENQIQFLNAYVCAQRQHGVFRPNPRLAFDYVQALIKSALFRLLPHPVALEIVERLRVAGGKKRHFTHS